MLYRLTLLVALVGFVSGKKGGKGSNSHENSADESGEYEEYNEIKNEERETGHQHKFWIPTYQGTNPLNRRKIDITTSEIEKYDKSVDVSLSGNNKNKTRDSNKPQNDDLSSMPLEWSGDKFPIKKNGKSLQSQESSSIILKSEDKSSKQSPLQDSQNKSLYNLISENKVEKKPNIHDKTMSTDIAPKPTLASNTKVKQSKINKTSEKNKTVKNQYVEEAITSHFFTELKKVTNETKLTSEYYKKLVKTATDNTKKKLGYKKINIPQNKQPSKLSEPEVYAVNFDSKSLEQVEKQDEIIFTTYHDRISKKPKDVKATKNIKKDNEKILQIKKEVLRNSVVSESGERLKFIAKNTKIPEDGQSINITEKMEENKIRSLQHVLSSEYSEKESISEIKKTENTLNKAEDSFTEYCDYSAWSDVLVRNKTKTKPKNKKLKKPSLSDYYQTSSEKMRKWPGKQLKKKADELRQKDRKVSRNVKKGKAQKKRQGQKQEGKSKDFYNQEYDESPKKVRMRTKGEKQYAIKEVKSYLKDMDKKYGRRPGQQTYQEKTREMSYESSDRSFGGRRKGRDFGYERQRSRDERYRGNKHEDERRYDRDDRGRDQKRQYTGSQRGYYRSNRGRSNRGSYRTGDKRGDWDNKRRDERDRRGRNYNRNSKRGRSYDRDSKRGRSYDRDSKRGRSYDRDSKRGRSYDRDSKRGISYDNERGSNTKYKKRYRSGERRYGEK